MLQKLLARLSLVTLLLAPGFTYALGLGEIDIHSALNQPLDAEIELVGFDPSEIDEIRVELASQDIFERVGVPRPFLLTRLKFTPTVVRGNAVIKVTSTDPIPEPFLTFLIDLRWSQGQLLREYTVLLDPPIFGDQKRATVQKPTVSAAQAPAEPTPTPPPIKQREQVVRTPEPAPPVTRRTPAAAPPPRAETAPSPRSQENSVTVKRGDTLWSVAQRHAAQAGVSVNQMMLAIQETNPHGFTDDNINNLKSGVILRIPPAEAARRYSQQQALAEVRRQWEVWKTGQQLADSADTAINVDSTGTGSDVSTTVQADAGSDSSKSKLSILGDDELAEGVSGADAAAAVKQLRNQIALLKESAESKEQVNVELSDRIESLESMLKKQEDIISLQNEQLAQLQNAASEAIEQAAEDSDDTVVATLDESATDTLGENQSDTTNTGIAQPKVEPLPDFTDPIPEEFLQAEAEAQAAEVTAESEPTTLAEQAVVEEPVVATTETPAQVSLMDQVMGFVEQQKQNLIYAGGGIAALIVGLFGFKAIRRRKEEAGTGLVEAQGLPVFDGEETINQAVDEAPIATPESVDEALDELEEIESVPQEDLGEVAEADSDEVIDEADVYISYGLYQQAEDLLKEALEKHPNNAAYHAKLAEVYYSENKVDEFVTQVESCEAKIDRNSPAWTKIASMGTALIPAHALFSGDTVVAPAEAEAPQSDAIEIPEDEIEDILEDDFDDNSLDFTLNDDDEVNEVDVAVSDELQSNSAPQALDTGLQEILEADELTADADSESETKELAELDAEDADVELDEEILDFDPNALEEELTSGAFEDDAISSEDATAMFASDDAESKEEELLDASFTAELEADVEDDALELDADESAVELDAANELDADLSFDDEAGTETAMFDSAVFNTDDLNTDDKDELDELSNELTDSAEAETAMFDSAVFSKDLDDSDELGEDTVSLEQLQENLTAELETLSFDGDEIDPTSLEEGLPTLQTEELNSRNIDDIDELADNLAASETGTFEADSLAESVTEQFDIEDIDTEMVDLGNFADDDDIDENPSVIEEVGTKLDLAKAFVDMGDQDAAKETLTEVMEQGDNTQIKEAKELLDKLT